MALRPVQTFAAALLLLLLISCGGGTKSPQAPTPTPAAASASPLEPAGTRGRDAFGWTGAAGLGQRVHRHGGECRRWRLRTDYDAERLPEVGAVTVTARRDTVRGKQS